MSDTPNGPNTPEDYLTLRQLHETLTKNYGIKISLSTLSEYAKKGVIKPDYSTSGKLLYLKVRVPGIADLLKTIKTNPQLQAEQQPPQQPVVVPLSQEQQEQISDITNVSLIKEILVRLQALEKQVQDQQLEIQQLKAKNLELETELNKKIKDLKKEETDDYNHLAEVININHNALNEHINNSEEYFEKLKIKLETLEKRVGDNELHEIEKEIARRLH